MTFPPTLGRPISQNRWPLPDKTPLTGRYACLVPLSPDQTQALWPVAQAAPDSFTYLRYGPFATQDDLRAVLMDLSSRPEQPFWAVLDENQSVQGWLSLCDIYPEDGAIEIGSIWFSPSLQGSRAAREALFLAMGLALDTLGYERLVWRCQAQNARSFNAALNLGFVHEGTWRNAAVVKGWQRDVAWFSILRSEWPARRDALLVWLAPENFDAAGRQKSRLQDHLRPA